jgi:hypothetical protein
LDFDEENLFIGGDKSIVVFKPFSPQAADIMTERTTWPPTRPADRQPHALPDRTSHYRQQNRRKRWTAVHHDSRSNHLFACAWSRSEENSTLLWTCDYRRTIWSDDSREIEGRTVALSIVSPLSLCDVWITLIRERQNDRIATSSSNYQSRMIVSLSSPVRKTEDKLSSRTLFVPSFRSTTSVPTFPFPSVSTILFLSSIRLRTSNPRQPKLSSQSI